MDDSCGEGREQKGMGTHASQTERITNGARVVGTLQRHSGKRTRGADGSNFMIPTSAPQNNRRRWRLGCLVRLTHGRYRYS